MYRTLSKLVTILRERESLRDCYAIRRHILIRCIIVQTVHAIGEIRSVCDLYVRYYALLYIHYVILWTKNKPNNFLILWTLY